MEDGSPCCEWVGENGAGHFVKMVHNGIEYGDMQLICEAYQLMRDYLRMSDGEMHQAFAAWNDTELDSYLIEITRDILAYKDVDGSPLVEHILDTAGQKGTGKWTATAALDEGVPLTLISEAVFSRCLSAMKDERVTAAAVFDRIIPPFTGDKELFVENIRQALYASKIISYAQGYTLMRAAAGAYGWNLNYGGIALMWRGGCIIRSAFWGRSRTLILKIRRYLICFWIPILKNHQGAASCVAHGCFRCSEMRCTGACDVCRAQLFRWIYDALPACQLAAGAKGLFRRTYLPALGCIGGSGVSH